MDKDKNTVVNNNAIENALRLMEAEGASGMSEDQIQSFLQDEACKQDCRDILDISLALCMEKESLKPDVEAELDRFKKKQSKKVRTTYKLWKASIGIAAMIALCFGICHFIPRQIEKSNEPVLVFKADHSTQQITLEKENGEKIVLEEPVVKSAVPLPKPAAPPINYTTAETYTITVPRGKNYQITLCDGTKVWLNANTHFIYPTAFAGNERIVSLDGEAYFEVSKDAKHPFIVKTPYAKIRVLGTEFNIRSYTPEDTHIVLIKGGVEVSTPTSDTYTKLVPGEDAHLQPDGAFVKSEVDLDSYIYWKDGFFYFDNATLKEIMESIGRWYNVNVEFRNPEAMEYKMHFASDRSRELEHTIELLNRMKKVTVTIRNNTITID